MQQGLIDAIESILKDQIQLASKINSLATRQYSALTANEDFSADEADELLAMTTKLEMLETERHAMLEGSAVTIENLLPLSKTLGDLINQLRESIGVMRESVKKNVAILDVQILRTRSMFEAVRQATGTSDEPIEYGPRGKVRRGTGGGLLGAG
jgi:flagellar biosynthesis/type III secretory pathway chaperone